MNAKWILVIAVVAVVMLRRGRQTREHSPGSRWGSLAMVACFAFVIMFLFMGNRGQPGIGSFRMPDLPSISFSSRPSMPTMPSEPSSVAEVHAPQPREKANHNHGISKLSYTSSAEGSFERTIVTTQDGAEIAIVQTSRSRAPRTYRGAIAEGVVFAAGALIVVAFLYIGFLFLDAGTRGQFTWTLRVVSIVAFGVICAAVALLRQCM